MNTVAITIDLPAVEHLRERLSQDRLDLAEHRLLNRVLPGWDTSVEPAPYFDEEFHRQMMLIEHTPADVNLPQYADRRMTFTSLYGLARVSAYIEGTEEEMRAALAAAIEKLSVKHDAARASLGPEWVPPTVCC